MNFNALDLNLIRVFDALMRERSATRAGERVGLSQPAVSAALNRLRHALNDQLFVRRGNDMVPTPRAEELAPLARSALSQIERMVELPGPFRPELIERTFTLMGSDFVSILMMSRLAERVAALAPKAALRLRDTAIGEVPRLLRDDVIDLAIEPAIPVQEGISSLLAFQSPFVAIAPAGHAALGSIEPGAVLPLELYCRLPHALRSVDGAMSGAVDRALEREGFARHVGLALPHFQAVALAVATGRYLAALPSQFAEEAARRLPVTVYRLPIAVPAPEIHLLWNSRHDSDRAHRWLRDMTMATVTDLGFDRGYSLNS